MTMRFERLSEKVGHKVCSYNFRHTWATRALATGVPAAHVAAMLGHTSTAMVSKNYGHLTEEAELLKEQAERVARRPAG
jgi:integrase